MTQPTKRPIILSQVQMAALEKIQNDEREKSPYGAAPSIPDIARGLIDIALAYLAAYETEKPRNASQNALIRHQTKLNQIECSPLALEQCNDSIIRTLNTVQPDSETDGKAGKK
ncbi:TPA: hypothetical protein MBF27_003549 [Klebsiella pneumoniae]|uniref:hypothetical protein n=1 Tax=Klebsiella TaxID=570 RepID=UPI000C79B6A2|nr:MULTISPECIES: hypothetical protein [Klebsiella]EKU0048219.1 hypothetical protein [Klebsiella quasipneumoniae]HDU4119651.1 hypothetical protein [Klebsiella pneumoniae subsp. pneumoniae]EIW9040927.1 hypothetical protein [Klebsiella pneumoniae]EKU3499710.1 hypothetical protein [Klebsiella quasipneumoniae]EKU3504601.1 hypothetical protein [Klebsiella quasipneumoniae]